MTETIMPKIWFPYLGIEIFNLDRVAFSIFGYDIYMYAICIFLGTILGLSVVLYMAKKNNLDINIILDAFFYLYIAALIGARTYYVVFEWSYYKDHLLEIFNLHNGGIAIYGGIIGAGLAMLLYVSIKKLSFLKYADLAVVGLALGQAIGRWGNFFNREAYGGYTDSLFAMRIIKEEATKLTPDLLNNMILVNGVEYIQVHPTFLYESTWNFMNFLFLFLYSKNKKFEGEVFAFYFLIYGIGRFLIEGLRQDQLLIWNTNIAVSQLLSLVFVFVATAFIIYGRKKLK